MPLHTRLPPESTEPPSAARPRSKALRVALRAGDSQPRAGAQEQGLGEKGTARGRSPQGPTPRLLIAQGKRFRSGLAHLVVCPQKLVQRAVRYADDILVLVAKRGL